MENVNIILWSLGGGFAVIFGLMLVMWHSLNGRIDKLDSRIDKLDEKVTDIDRRLCRIEGSLMSKDCCMLKDDRQQKKAE